MSVLSRSRDQKPYIQVKDAILARSGMYYYTYEEVLAKGHKPKVVKDMYAEYRPPAVVAAAAPLFDLVPVPNAEHTMEDITSDNFHDHASGVVGGPISVVPMPDGINIGLKGRIAFYTKEAHNYYSAGNKETSADYTSVTVLVDNPEEVGYDLLMKEIVSVNNVAITQRGRGGKDVRVQDSAPVGKVIDDILNRRKDTMSILTKLLGLDGQQKESFAAEVKDSLQRFKGLAGEAKAQEIEGVIGKVASLTSSTSRDALLGVVRDAYVHSDTVLSKWKDTEKLIDGLYSRCLDAEEEVLAGIKDAEEGKEKKEDKDEKEKEDKGGKSKDSASVQDTALLIDAKISELQGSLPKMIADGIKAALGDGADVHGAAMGGVKDSVSAEDIDYSKYTDDAFGRLR